MPRMVDLGDVIGKRYRLDRKIARTAFSEVFEGTQLNTRQTIAVKILRLDTISKEDRQGVRLRFQREIAAYGKLRHPNLVRLIDVGDLPHIGLYIVLEFVEGETLADFLAREGSIIPFEAKHLMSQCLDALCSGHTHGVVHRDFKPRNVMITSTGSLRNAVVLDFGLAGGTAAWKSMVGRAVTGPDEVAGSVAYLAPEQIEGDVTPQTDLYAWALVYLECLLGRPVFDGKTDYEVIMKHMREDVVVPEPLGSHPLGKILTLATARSLEKRYKDSVTLLNDLRECGMAALDLTGASTTA